MPSKFLHWLFCLGSATFALAQNTSPILGNERCQALAGEGQALKADNKFNEALAKYREAAAADPTASMPLSLMASLFHEASGMTDAKNVEPYRNQARALAQDALSKHPDDPLALEVLRDLSGETRNRALTSSEEAAKAYREAETYFGKKQYREALERYLTAFAKDPKFSKAILYAGDCHFDLKEFKEAEACYGKATALDPDDAQAWRFLADAQYALKRPSELVKKSILNAISAQPNYLPAWARYEEIRNSEGTPLKVFNPEPKAQLSRDAKTGKYNLQLQESKDNGSLDSTLWVAFGMGLAAAQPDVSKETPVLSPFQIQLKAWEGTMTTARELASEKKPIKDPTLLQFKAFGEAKHLETGIFLFLYKEAYRPDFEAWKKKNPKGVETFLEVFSLRPPVH